MNGSLRHLGPSPLVAFDFDGTLTCHDSFIGFLAWRLGRARLVAGAAALLPALTAYGLDRDRGALKAAAVRRFLRGTTRNALAAEAERYRQAAFDALMRPDALACWSEWQARGAALAIVTASPEIIVAPFARALGADHLIGTRLVLDADDQVTGALDGANCRGPEKVARLREAFGLDVHLAAAYGDTAGDREMLAMAEAPGYRVFSQRP